MEDFDADWAKIAERTGLPKVASVTGARTSLWSTDKPSFTAQSADAVRAAYRVDFERFDYDLSLPPD